MDGGDRYCGPSKRKLPTWCVASGVSFAKVVSRIFRTFGLAERHPALAHAVMAPLICWSFSNSMFRYRLVDHAVPAMWRSLAAARLSAYPPRDDLHRGRVAADRLSGFFDSAPGAGGELAWRFAKSAGAPLELLTDPTRWTSHRFRRLAACQTILNAI